MDEESATDDEPCLLTLELILLDLTWVRTPKVDIDHRLIPTVCFKVLDFPLVMFSCHQEPPDVKPTNVIYNQGKSCVFSTALSRLRRQLRTYPIYTFLMDTGHQPAPMVAFGAFPLQAVLDDMARFAADPGNWPTVSAQQGEACLRNTRGQRVAWISFALRLSCLSDGAAADGGQVLVAPPPPPPPPCAAWWPEPEPELWPPPAPPPAAGPPDRRLRAAKPVDALVRPCPPQESWVEPRASPRRGASPPRSASSAAGGDARGAVGGSCWRAPLESDADGSATDASSGPIVTRLIQELAAMQRATADSRDVAVQTRPSAELQPRVGRRRGSSAGPRRPSVRRPAIAPVSTISEEPVTEGFWRRRATGAVPRQPVATTAVDRLTRGQPVATRGPSGAAGRRRTPPPRLRPVTLTRTAQLRLAQHMSDVRHDLKAEEYSRRRGRWLVEQRRRLEAAGRRRQLSPPQPQPAGAFRPQRVSSRGRGGGGGGGGRGVRRLPRPSAPVKSVGVQHCGVGPGAAEQSGSDGQPEHVPSIGCVSPPSSFSEPRPAAGSGGRQRPGSPPLVAAVSGGDCPPGVGRRPDSQSPPTAARRSVSAPDPLSHTRSTPQAGSSTLAHAGTVAPADSARQLEARSAPEPAPRGKQPPRSQASIRSKSSCSDARSQPRPATAEDKGGSTDVSRRYSSDQFDASDERNSSGSSSGRAAAARARYGCSASSSMVSSGVARCSSDGSATSGVANDRHVTEEEVTHSHITQHPHTARRTDPTSHISERIEEVNSGSDVSSSAAESVQDAEHQTPRASSGGSGSSSSSSSTITGTSDTVDESESKHTSLKLRAVKVPERLPPAVKSSESALPVERLKPKPSTAISAAVSGAAARSPKVSPSPPLVGPSPTRTGARPSDQSAAKSPPPRRRDSGAGGRPRAPSLRRVPPSHSRSSSHDSEEIEARIAMYLEQTRRKTERRQQEQKQEREPAATGGWLKGTAAGGAGSWLKTWRVDGDDGQAERRPARGRHTLTGRQPTGAGLNTDSVSSYVPSDVDALSLSDLSPL